MRVHPAFDINIVTLSNTKNQTSKQCFFYEFYISLKILGNTKKKHIKCLETSFDIARETSPKYKN